MPEYKKKLIEVALPLEAINKESAREKSIRHGHPSTLHLWWARRPLAACRAVLFSSLVDDPSAHPDKFPTDEAQERERQRLFRIIEDLVKWDNVNNEEVLGAARREILRSTDGNPPPVLDPFAGGGSIPLEAQRLGLEAHASDLNPVPVLINKALIEIPPKFAGQAPVNPEARENLGHSGRWKGAAGLAEDVRYYGRWMRDEAERRIGHLYPKVTLPKEHGGGEATVIAWLWARTVTCPNPACGARMPLVRSFDLSKKKAKRAWVEPVVDRAQTPPEIRFEVRTGNGKPRESPKVGRGATFRCLACDGIADEKHIKGEAMANRMGSQLMATVAEGNRQRVYLPPDAENERIAASATPDADVPSQPLANDPRNIWCVNYGLDTFDKLFTPRQLVALTTFSDLVGEAREQVRTGARAAGLDEVEGYGDAVVTYLAFAVDRSVDRGSTACTWDSSPKMEALRNTFGRQAIPMTWDFAEGNAFSESSGNWLNNVEWTAKVIDKIMPNAAGKVSQRNATDTITGLVAPMISTDPPYYDNIGYADLSDFFYVWLRRSLRTVYPNLLSTLLTPKTEELVATPYRFDGSKRHAQEFFEHGLGEAFGRMREVQDAAYPLTVFYAFKQSERAGGSDGADGSTASTGWETMLEGMIRSGFSIGGTWPMRSELSNRMIASGTNALASSIVLVCRPRPADAPMATRRQFLAELKRELPDALRNLQHGNIAPVDLAQAAIGPGMAVFSRHGKVLESDGTPMRVRPALALINHTLVEVLAEQEGEFDTDTRFAVAWFDQFGMSEGAFGQADVLARAKNTSVAGLEQAGVVHARSGKVRLLSRDEMDPAWDPATDTRVTAWEVTQHLIRALDTEGETGAAALLRRVGGLGEVARALAYRLYTTCERKKWAHEALAYNSMVKSWPEISHLAQEQQPAAAGTTQLEADLK